jgi:XTP/dITP diphosphohydrolase
VSGAPTIREARPASGAPVLVVATGNAGKLAELRALLAPLPLRVAGLSEFAPVAFPDEGDDYAANAEAKARAAALALALPALGDDSGLEVDALGGGPGPRSARYGGPGLDDAGRCGRLLSELGAAGDRAARFVCVAALALPDGAVTVVRGECPGRILAAPRGVNGFGYDPVFQPEGWEASMAELSPHVKHRISHRGRALAALGPALASLSGSPSKRGTEPSC